MKKSIIQTVMNVNNNKVNVMRIDNIDYISITDLATYANSNDPSGSLEIGCQIKIPFLFIHYGKN